MKLTPTLLALVAAQSGDDFDGVEKGSYQPAYAETNTYSYSAPSPYVFSGGAGRAGAFTKAKALSCWDSNEYRNVPYHHQDGEPRAYGEFGSQSHGNIAAGNEWTGVNHNAKEFYGHYVSGSYTGSPATANRPHWRANMASLAEIEPPVEHEYWSLRHPGCLYEVHDWIYNAQTFNMYRFLTYDQAGLPKAVHVHWLHVFNAHIHIDFHHRADTSITGSAASGRADRAALVMANPTYEGLGYLNFVATYRDTNSALAMGDEWSRTNALMYMDFYDGWKLYYGEKACTPAANCAPTYADMGNWQNDLTAQTATWAYNVFNEATPQADFFWHGNRDRGTHGRQINYDVGFAISSFPHNQLGKDFRFNVRTLHTMGWGRQWAGANTDAAAIKFSYYIYGVSKITITFPFPVSNYHTCVNDSQNPCAAEHVDKFIVDHYHQYYDHASTGPLFHESPNFHGLKGTITPNCAGHGVAFAQHACASWCQKGFGITCGTTLEIVGMESTYDEKYLRQYGTLQEIWVQLMYAYSARITATTGYESPFPNIFFNANEVVSVAGECKDEGCWGYTMDQNVPKSIQNGHHPHRSFP